MNKLMERPLTSGSTAEITLIARHFAQVARLVLNVGTPVIVTVDCGCEDFLGVRLDRHSLYVRWEGNGLETISALWIKTGEDKEVLFWPSVDSFDGGADVPVSLQRTVKSIHIPIELA